jgi:hypothetical protein
MTQKDRSEIREMIHGILSGWHATTTAQNDITNASLGEIKDHLVKINGKVAEHEKVINVNLPHHIALCPQRDAIEDLKIWKEQEEAKENELIHQEHIKTRNWTKIMNIISIVIAFLAMLFGYIKLENNQETLNQKVNDLGTPVLINPRGVVINDSLSVKMWPRDFNDTIK